MKSIEEITDYIENTHMDGSEKCSLRLGNAIIWLCEVVKSQDKSLKRASDVASCLVSGIQPD